MSRRQRATLEDGMRINFYLSQASITRLGELAERVGVSRSEYLQWLIDTEPVGIDGLPTRWVVAHPQQELPQPALIDRIAIVT